MITLGVILLIVGFIAKVSIIWTLGIILLVIGGVLALLGALGREVGGRRQTHQIGAHPTAHLGEYRRAEGR